MAIQLFRKHSNITQPLNSCKVTTDTRYVIFTLTVLAVRRHEVHHPADRDFGCAPCIPMSKGNTSGGGIHQDSERSQPARHAGSEKTQVLVSNNHSSYGLYQRQNLLPRQCRRYCADV
jgi:hypothetical protein